MSTTPPLLTLRGVHTHIGAYHILHGVNLDVRPGQLMMLLGRNGAGKTTTLRTIMGLWPASKGEIHFDGVTIGGAGTRLRTPDIARLGIAYVPESMGIFGELSVRENMLLAARGARRLEQLDTARVDWLFRLFPALRQFWRYPAGALSGGQKQMLAIARAMIEPRRMLLIDEPSKGLAPAMVARLVEALGEIKHTNTAIVLVEQNLSVAEALGDHVAVIEDGAVAYRGAMAEFSADAALRQRLLGLNVRERA